jgi:hypothetical protein
VGSFALGAVSFVFYNAAGRVVGPPEPFLRGAEVEIVEGPDGRRYQGLLTFNPEFAEQSLQAIVEVHVRVGDRAGGQSPAVRTRLVDPTPVGLDEPCEATSAQTICPAGAECFSDDPQRDPTPRCHMVAGFCPEGWDVITLDALPDGQNWVYRGNLNRFQDDLQEHGVGVCSALDATGFNDVLSFTAPANGNYVIEVETLGDTIVWARSHCDVPGAESELGCNDDDPEGQLGRGSRVEITPLSWPQPGRLFGLRVRETMYIFVDSYGEGGRGQYSVTVRRL